METWPSYWGVRDVSGNCVRRPGGTPLRNRTDLIDYKADFEWGYEGKGPLQLALAILADHLRDDARAVKLHEAFAAESTYTLATAAWEMPPERITNAVKRLEAQQA